METQIKLQTNTDFCLDSKIGYMIKPNITLLLTSNVSGYDHSGIGRERKRDFGVVAPVIQYLFSNRFYLLAGIGIDVDAPVFFDIVDSEKNKEETAYYKGVRMLGAVGYKLY